MGCRCSKAPALNQHDKAPLVAPRPEQVPPLAEYIIPDPSPWITPISRARIIIPRCVAGDLQVQHEVFQKEQPSEIMGCAATGQTMDATQAQPPLEINERKGSDQSAKRKSITLELPSAESKIPMPDPPSEWAEINEMKNELLSETDPAAIAENTALVPFVADKPAEPSNNFDYQAPSPTNTQELNFDSTVVEAQTFVGRDESGAAHLINMHTIRHPACEHDPLKGEIHIQITHKTPIGGCHPYQSEPRRPSQNEMPAEITILEKNVDSKKKSEDLQIRMGVPVQSGRSRTSQKQRCQERRQKSTSGRCIPSSRTTRKVAVEYVDDQNPLLDDNGQHDAFVERFLSMNDIVSEPIIQPTHHIPPTKCSHSRVSASQESWKPECVHNSAASLIHLETNSSAHSDTFSLADCRTLTRGIPYRFISPDKRLSTMNNLSETSALKTHPDFQSPILYENTSKKKSQKTDLLCESGTRSLKHGKVEYRREARGQTEPVQSSYYTMEVTSPIPNESLEEWNVQAAVQHLGASSIHFPGMRDSKKTLKRVILDRVPGLRSQDNPLQSVPSNDSPQNSTSVTPYPVRESRGNQIDGHINLHRVNSKQMFDWERLPVGKTVTQSLSSAEPSEPSPSFATPTPTLQQSVAISSTDIYKSSQEDYSVGELNTSDQSPGEQMMPGDRKLFTRTPSNKVQTPMYTRVQSSTSTVRCFRAHSPSFMMNQVDYQASVSSLPRNAKEGAFRKRQPVATPCFLPPIQSHTGVNASTMATGKRNGLDTTRNGKESKHDVTKTAVALPKLSSDSISGSDQGTTRNPHNNDRRRLRGPPQNKGKLYDILVLHQPKRK